MCDFCFYVYIFVDLKRRSAPTNSAPTTFQWNYITCSFNLVTALRYVLEDIYVVVLKIYVYVCFIIWKLESVSCFILLSTSIHMNIVVFLVWLLWIPFVHMKRNEASFQALQSESGDLVMFMLMYYFSEIWLFICSFVWFVI